VAILAFFLPAGGAVAAIRDLERMGVLDAKQARDMIAATIAVFAIGTSALLVAAGLRSNTSTPINYDAGSVLSIGVALAAYWAVRGPYQRWRARSPGMRPGSWLSAAGTAVLYEMISLAALLPVALVMVLARGQA
jgi:hypothetical protein